MKRPPTIELILGSTFLFALLKTHQNLAGSVGVPWWLNLMWLWLLLLALAWFGRRQLLPMLFQLIGGMFRGIVGVLSWLLISPQTGARFMSWWESLTFFGGRGWLVDGKRKRLSEKVSFQGIVMEAGVGGGKTSTQVFPNIYSLNHASLVITDTSGELYEQTSGFLKQHGYALQVLNLREVSRSHGYNPLALANTFTEVAQLAHLLIRSSPATGNTDDAYWTAGAEKIVRVLIQCLKNRATDKPATLARVKELLGQLATVRDAQHPFSQWVMESTLEDRATWQDYLTIIGGNEKTTQSFLSTADVGLMAIANPELAALTSLHDFDFGQLQKRKTALFVLCRQQDMTHYAFLLSAFFTQLFNALLATPDPRHLPVYCLLDEFGQITVPNFATIASTARKYKVGLYLFLQSAAQLEFRYSKAESQTILDSLRTQIFLSGTNLDAAERVSRRLGKRRPQSVDDRIAYADANLLNPDEIITMKEHEALLLHGNKRAHRFKVLPYFRHGRFSQWAKLPPAELPRLAITPINTEPLTKEPTHV